mgnify:CR=1 FL=1
MPTVHVRLTGSQDDLRILADLVNDLDGIERIEVLQEAALRRGLVIEFETED